MLRIISSPRAGYWLTGAYTMKVMKKPKIVDAVQYERGLGLEDGFLYGYWDKDGAFRESTVGAANTM